MALALPMLVIAGLVAEASAHGKLTVPKSRNEQWGGGPTCAHCLNGEATACGDSPGSNAYLNHYAGPQATWTAGSIVPVTIVVTAHHRGHYEMRICDKVLNSNVADPEACLSQWVLERASPEEAGFTDCKPGDERPACVPFDPKHPERWYLPPSGEITGTHTMYWKVPAGLQCTECTLQWHWWSANSCIPAGDYGCYKDILQSNGYWVGSKSAWWTVGAGSCSGPAGPNGHSGCGEQFQNCADIRVLSGGGPMPMPMPVPVPVPTPTTVPSPMPTPTSTSAATTTAPGSPTCKAVPESAKYGATDTNCALTCEALPLGHWPCGAGHMCDCSGQATTATTTTASSSVMTTREQGKTCRPTAGLPPNGATDSNCAQCATGYQWWPCNTNPAICTCTGSSLAEIGVHTF